MAREHYFSPRTFWFCAPHQKGIASPRKRCRPSTSEPLLFSLSCAPFFSSFLLAAFALRHLFAPPTSFILSGSAPSRVYSLPFSVDLLPSVLPSLHLPLFSLWFMHEHTRAYVIHTCIHESSHRATHNHTLRKTHMHDIQCTHIHNPTQLTQSHTYTYTETHMHTHTHSSLRRPS